MEFPGADALAVFAALVALAVLTFVGVAYRRLVRETRGLPTLVRGKPWQSLTWEEKMAFAARKRRWELLFVAVASLALLGGFLWSYVEYVSGSITWRESLLVSAGVIVTVALCVLGSELVWRR
ncbi:MAG: hypothetical protein AB1503_13000 [Bacillota bacterium]